MHGRPKDIQKGNWIRRPGDGIGDPWHRIKEIKHGAKYTRVTLENGEKLEYESCGVYFYETHPGYARND